MFNLLKETLVYVLATLIHNGPILAFGILIAAIMEVYVDPEKFKEMLTKGSTSITCPWNLIARLQINCLFIK